MVELRKRKTPPPAPPPAAKKERKTKAKKDNAEAASSSTKTAASALKTKATEGAPKPPPPSGELGMGVSKTPAVPESGSKTSSDPPKVGDTIELQGFGGEIETNDGEKVTLQALVEKSDAGVVLFTYPKASTPGCTNQACLFRDSFEPLTKTGLSIFGLSTDSPKANTTFKTKQKLPYTLLCDPQTSLIAAIGFKKSPKGTQRGVFVVQKDGKVLAAEPGGPAATVEVVKGVVDSMGGTDADGEKALEKAEVRATEAEGDEVESDKKMADTAGEVADTAEKLEDSA